MAIEKREKIVALTFTEEVLQVTRQREIIEDGNVLFSDTLNNQYTVNLRPGRIENNTLILEGLFLPGSVISMTVNNASFRHETSSERIETADDLGQVLVKALDSIVVEIESVDVDGMYAETHVKFKASEDATDYLPVDNLNIKLGPLNYPQDVGEFLQQSLKRFSWMQS